MAHDNAPRLEPRLFHPRYWASWFGLSLLWLLVLLPWRSQMWLGRQLGSLARKLLKSRVKIARRNLELAMPELTKDEREKLLKQNFESVGCAIFEVGMAWFWPDWRMRNLMKVEGEEHVIAAMEKGQACCCSPAISSRWSSTPAASAWYGPGSASTVPTPTLCWVCPVPRSLRLQQIPGGPDGRERDDQGAAQRRCALVCAGS